MLNVISFLLCSGFVRVTQGEGANFLSKRDDDYSPTYLWSLDPDHHGDNGNKHSLYGVLRNASLTSGPDFTNSSTSNSSAMQFLGDPWSFMQIANVNGTLDPSRVFTWSMFLQADFPLTGSGVIMEYSTLSGDGFFRVRQDGEDLLVDAVDDSGQQLNLVVGKLFKDYTWPFVCVTFISEYKRPSLRVFYDEFDVLKPGKREEQQVVNGTVLLGEGDVRFGASFQPSLPAFAGKLSCLRFHDKYVVKFHDDPSYLLDCHPGGTFSDLSERTIDYEDMTAVTTTPIFTIEVTTASNVSPQSATSAAGSPSVTPPNASGLSTSPEASTESPSTEPSATSSAPSATTEPSTTSPATTEPSATSSTPSAAAPSIVTASSLADESLDICDCCMSLTQHPGYSNPASVSGLALGQLVVDNLGACSRSCALTAGCTSIALETQVRDAHVPGNCFLLGGVVSTVSAGSLYVYQLA